MLLKLILIANQKRNESHDYGAQLKKLVDEKYYFQKLHWPIMLSQSDCNNNINFTFEMCRLIALIRQLEKKDDLSKRLIQKFIHERGFDSIVSYAASFLLLVVQFYIGTSDNNSKFCIEANEQLSTLLDPLCINNKNNIEYLTIKAHPVYKKNNYYYVLNWNYFSNQIYTGTYMALKKYWKRIK